MIALAIFAPALMCTWFVADTVPQEDSPRTRPQVQRLVQPLGQPVEQTPRVKLNGSIELDLTLITITNEDSYAWSDINIVLNGGFTSRYETSLSGLNSGAWKQVPLRQFTFNGNRFSPRELVPESITLYADTPSGRGSMEIEYD